MNSREPDPTELEIMKELAIIDRAGALVSRRLGLSLSHPDIEDSVANCKTEHLARRSEGRSVEADGLFWWAYRLVLRGVLRAQRNAPHVDVQRRDEDGPQRRSTADFNRLLEHLEATLDSDDWGILMLLMKGYSQTDAASRHGRPITRHAVRMALDRVRRSIPPEYVDALRVPAHTRGLGFTIRPGAGEPPTGPLVVITPVFRIEEDLCVAPATLRSDDARDDAPFTLEDAVEGGLLVAGTRLGQVSRFPELMPFTVKDGWVWVYAPSSTDLEPFAVVGPDDWPDWPDGAAYLVFWRLPQGGARG